MTIYIYETFHEEKMKTKLTAKVDLFSCQNLFFVMFLNMNLKQIS